MPFVEFNNVTFGYKEDDYLLLEDLSFSVEKNDIITVIGASGCGKSTLFRLMTCLETATRARYILTAGHRKKQQALRHSCRRRICLCRGGIYLRM